MDVAEERCVAGDIAECQVFLDRLFALRFARRDPIGRALSLSARGEAFLESLKIPG